MELGEDAADVCGGCSEEESGYKRKFQLLKESNRIM